jgi:hypothetical protein
MPYKQNSISSTMTVTDMVLSPRLVKEGSVSSSSENKGNKTVKLLQIVM